MLEGATAAGWADFIQKVLLVLLGWGLGFGSQTVREWWTRRKTKKALREELEILLERIKEVQLGYMRSLQLYAHGIGNTSLGLKVPHAIYSNYYKEVYSHLTPEERQSYDYIHGHVDAMNDLIEQEKIRGKEFYANPNSDTLNALGDMFRSQFMNASSILWFIQNHLQNLKPPGLKIGSATHAALLQEQKNIRLKTEEIIEKAKRLDVKGDILRTGASIKFVNFDSQADSEKGQ